MLRSDDSTRAARKSDRARELGVEQQELGDALAVGGRRCSSGNTPRARAARPQQADPLAVILVSQFGAASLGVIAEIEVEQRRRRARALEEAADLQYCQPSPCPIVASVMPWKRCTPSMTMRKT